ncbi:hypothetical protein [Sporichthya sp.]|uniref:hypothetical protein n=1 Tax=Sporichthya sp. TaxID=65475 RepID=UPI0018124B47|nr:hypothetical protein [Sporichthya sp.]MBA3745221.1 hypothetical protein [Sporichthya sp.]
MRKSAISAAAVLSSVALLSVGAPTVSQAATSFTQRELTVCWNNETPSADNPNFNMDLEAVADGPSYKSFSLDNGECVRWDVRPGQYKMTVEDMDEFLDDITDALDSCAADEDDRFQIRIKRMGDTYKAFNVAALLNGEVTTNVKKDRSTSISVNAYCVDV